MSLDYDKCADENDNTLCYFGLFSNGMTNGSDITHVGDNCYETTLTLNFKKKKVKVSYETRPLFRYINSDVKDNENLKLLPEGASLKVEMNGFTITESDGSTDRIFNSKEYGWPCKNKK